MPRSSSDPTHPVDAPDQFVRCRALGHTWEGYVPFPPMAAPSFGWRMSLRCASCGTERHDLVSHRDGDVLAREYRYPDGYQISGGGFAPSRGEYRLALAQRAIIEHTAGPDDGGEHDHATRDDLWGRPTVEERAAEQASQQADDALARARAAREARGGAA